VPACFEYADEKLNAGVSSFLKDRMNADEHRNAQVATATGIWNWHLLNGGRCTC
jgi:hypothetical protein